MTDSSVSSSYTIVDDTDVGDIAAPNIRSRTITLPSRGVALHYIESYVSLDDPLIICVHGWPEFWFAWRHQIPVLTTKGRCRVVAVDMRGFGRTRVVRLSSIFCLY
jgi:pimeloyl-ACP methyl ester carboxylesterase